MLFTRRQAHKCSLQSAGCWLAGDKAKARVTAATAPVAPARGAKGRGFLTLAVGYLVAGPRAPAGIHTPHTISTSLPGSRTSAVGRAEQSWLFKAVAWGNNAGVGESEWERISRAAERKRGRKSLPGGKRRPQPDSLPSRAAVLGGTGNVPAMKRPRTLLTVVISDVAKRTRGELLKYLKSSENTMSATHFLRAESNPQACNPPASSTRTEIGAPLRVLQGSGIRVVPAGMANDILALHIYSLSVTPI